MGAEVNYTGPNLVSFVGSIGAGKSTCAKYLEENHGFTRVRFAGPLKDMMKAIGLTDAQVDGDEKEISLPILGGKTPRHAMQTLGTEWGRDCMGPHFWKDLWKSKVKKILDSGGRVVVDDCRFENEDVEIRNLGGIHVRVHRGIKITDAMKKTWWELFLERFVHGFNRGVQTHVSEAYSVKEDYSILNLWEPSDLYWRIELLLRYGHK